MKRRDEREGIEFLVLQKALDPASHLAGRLVRKGHRQNIVRRNVLFGDQIRDSHRNDTRLARTGPRKYQ